MTKLANLTLLDPTGYTVDVAFDEGIGVGSKSTEPEDTWQDKHVQIMKYEEKEIMEVLSPGDRQTRTHRCPSLCVHGL